MSYTFSRRDFMKLSALTAVAVAGAGLFTGCGSNPNRPVGKIGDTLSPGSRICDATLLGGDDVPTYDAAGKKLVCKFKIYTRVGQLQITKEHFQVNVTDAEGKEHRYYNGVQGITVVVDGGSATGLDQYKEVTPTLTKTGIEDLDQAKSVKVSYIPKMYANGSITDSYSDVFATWDITSAMVKDTNA